LINLDQLFVRRWNSQADDVLDDCLSD